MTDLDDFLLGYSFCLGLLRWLGRTGLRGHIQQYHLSDRAIVPSDIPMVLSYMLVMSYILVMFYIHPNKGTSIVPYMHIYMHATTH